MPLIKQSSAGTPLTFFLVLASDHLTGAPGLSPTVTISKNGAAYAAPAGAISDNGNGWYAVAGNATDCNTLGPIDLHATAATADPCDMKDVAQIVSFDPANGTSLGLADLDTTVSSRMATFTLPTNFSALLITAGGAVTVGTNTDKTGYSLTQTFPANFSALSIDLSGRIDVGKWLGTAVAAATAGIPDVNTKNIANTAAAVDANNLLKVDVEDWKAEIVPAPNVTGVPKVDVVDWLGVAPNALIAGRVDSNAQVVGDKSGYSLAQAFPANFSSLGIDVSGRVDLGKWIGVAPAALTASGYVQAALLRWKTDDAAGTPNALISGRVDANAGVVGDKSGYTLTQAFPTNFSSQSIDVSGRVDLGKWVGVAPNALIVGRVDSNVGVNNDKTGYSLVSSAIQAIYDYSASLLTTIGSIGKQLATNVDVPISTGDLDTANGVESGWTVRQLFRLWLAGICGPRSSFGTAAPVVQNPAGTKNRLTGSGIDANGDGTWTTDVT